MTGGTGVHGLTGKALMLVLAAAQTDHIHQY
jgi:hypothetical protein